MSVAIFTGTIRSGKSLEGVKVTIDNLAKGRHVYTNIEGLDDSKCVAGICGIVSERKPEWDDYEIQKHLHFLTEDKVREFPKYIEHQSSCILIDEAHNHFDAREWDSPGRKEVNTWVKMSGHYGHDIVFLTHDVDELDKRIKTLVEWTYRFTKVDYVGKLVKHKYEVQQFKFAQIKSKFASFYRTYDKRIFECYKSFVAPDIIEIGAVKRPNILMHWSIFMVPVVLVLMVYMGWKSSFFSGDFLGAKKIQKEQQKLLAPMDRRKAIPASRPKELHVYEYKDIVKPETVKIPIVSPELQSAPEQCRTVSTVKIFDDTVEVRDCGSYTVSLRNGKEQWRGKGNNRNVVPHAEANNK